MNNFLPTDSNLIKLGSYLHLYHSGMSDTQLAHRFVIFVIIICCIAFLLFALIVGSVIYFSCRHRLKVRCKQLNLNYEEEKIRIHNESVNARYNRFYAPKKKHKR